MEKKRKKRTNVVGGGGGGSEKGREVEKERGTDVGVEVWDLGEVGEVSGGKEINLKNDTKLWGSKKINKKFICNKLKLIKNNNNKIIIK